jgi:hypothetical protein
MKNENTSEEDKEKKGTGSVLGGLITLCVSIYLLYVVFQVMS